jgi:hypothetical protein
VLPAPADDAPPSLLVQERFDLAGPDDLADDPRTLRLLSMLGQRGVRRELGELGYDAERAGELLCKL